MTKETLEVDRDYLWALEVVACHNLENREEQSEDKLDKAGKEIDNASLKRPLSI